MTLKRLQGGGVAIGVVMLDRRQEAEVAGCTSKDAGMVFGFGCLLCNQPLLRYRGLDGLEQQTPGTWWCIRRFHLQSLVPGSG